MTIREAYEQIHADYESVMNRMHTDEKLMKYLVRFVNENYDIVIQNAIREQDYDTAFRESHNLKGLCYNLDIPVLGKSASNLTEALRSRNPDGNLSYLVDIMQHDYNTTMDAFRKVMEN